LASTWTRRRVDEQASGSREQEVAVCHPALEDRARRSGLLVHVGVEGVAGEVREVLDVFEGDQAAVGEQRVTELQLLEVHPEGVSLAGLGQGLSVPGPGDPDHHLGGQPRRWWPASCA
jgi:hypothetical protein